jgi:SAM-dependent methyltransferase
MRLARVLASLPLTREARRRAYLARLPEHLARWRGFEAAPGSFDGIEVEEVACAACPKLARRPARCTVPFGSRLRSCICASSELHLRVPPGARVLEIGCGESSFARAVIESSGGRWVGLDPRAGKAGKDSVRSVGGLVQRLPFQGASFDAVCGTQTLEHWEDPLAPHGKLGYASTLAEIWRVLRPGGWIYLDAPIHLHGASEFVRGDLAAIRAIFAHQPWQGLRFTSWRRLHEPLAAHRAPAHERERWPRIVGGDRKLLARLARQAAWILAIRAAKPG